MELKEIWNYKHLEAITGIEFGDINNNGEIEIIAHSNKGKIIVFSLEGKKLLETEVSGDSAIWKIKSCDIDNDGKNELIIGGMDGLLRIFKCSPSYQLQPTWAHQFGGSISGFLIDDINNDGVKEIIAYSLDKSIRILNPMDGKLIWGQVFEDGIGDAIVWNKENGLINKEVIACGNDGTIRSFNGENGELSWFKRFSDKIRCVSLFKSIDGPIISCGGDDNLLYFVDPSNQKEIISLQYCDIIWKSLVFPLVDKDKLLMSTYSFSYLDDNIPIEKIDFTSKLACINAEFKTLWEVTGINIENLNIIEKASESYIVAGTTIGEIIIINSLTGEKKSIIERKSCTNMVKAISNENLIISCHDNGSLYAFKLDLA